MRASRLVMIWNSAFDTTSPSGSSAAQPRSCASPFGRMTISAPAMPPASSSQRQAEMRSPSVSAASSVISSGVSMTMAVNSPTGITCRLKKASTLSDSRHSPRSSCRPGRSVRSSARPRRGSTVTAVTPTWNR